MAAHVPLIVGLEPGAQDLSVRFDARTDPVRYSWRWLRDHSEDAASLDQATLQRAVDTFSLDNSAPESVELIGGIVHISWSAHTPVAHVSGTLLANVACLIEEAGPVTWDVSSLPSPIPEVSHAQVSRDDCGVLAWLESIEAIGFGIVRGAPTNRDDIEALARRIAYPRGTIFGAMWTLSSERVDHADTAYSQTYLEPHTDGSYVIDAPGLQMFACLERDGTGGESILVDGFAATDRLRRSAPDAFTILTEVDVPGRYLEPGVHLRASRPTIRVDHSGQVRQVTFNNYDRAPFLLEPDRQAAWYDAYQRLHDEIVDRRHWLLVGLGPGDVLVFDNWRVLHGRMAYTGRRVFEGCYHNHEDFESRLRVLRDGRSRVQTTA